MIKLIALDLDNTLLEKDNTIPETTLNLLKECVSKGITPVIATGRLLFSADKYARLIDLSCKIVCYNGSLITDGDNNVLFSQQLSVDIMKKIIAFAKERKLYCQFYHDHKIVVEKVTEGTLIDPDLKNTETLELGDFFQAKLNPSPKAMIVAPPERVAAYQAELSAVLQNTVYIAQSQPYLIEIMPAGVNKANSLQVLCDSLGISPHQAMACGDNTNDAEMLRWAGLGVAVSNSVNSLKEIADYVCQSPRSKGVEEAIKKFILMSA